MDIGIKLRNCSKGKLYYENQPETPTQTKNWLNSLNQAPYISKIHCDTHNFILKHADSNVSSYNKENISSINNNADEDSFYTTCYDGLSPPPKAIQTDPVSVSTQPKQDLSPKSDLPPKPVNPKPIEPRTCVSPEFGKSAKSIREYEIEWEDRAKIAKEKKRKEFDDNSKKLMKMQEEQLILSERNRYELLKHLDQQTQKHLRDKVECEKQVQVIKESHKHHSQMLDAKVVEVEKRKQQLKEEERKRQQEEFREMISRLNSSIEIVFKQFMQLYNSCEYKNLYSPAAVGMHNQVTALKSKADNIVTSSKTSVLTQEMVKNLMVLFEESKNRLEAINPHIVEAKKKGEEQEASKAAEAAKANEVKQQQTITPATPTAPTTALTPSTPASTQITTAEDVMVDALEEYTKLQGKLKQVTESLKAFTENTQLKKYKFELQKAVNTPINAISAEKSSHLQDKLQRLNYLLSGHTVESTGKRISAKEVPEGILFCKNLAAKMIVKKGSEQVASKHDTAFGIAAVTVGIWCNTPDIGDLILAHFHQTCPYTVPISLPKLEEQSIETYHKLLGYKVEDGVIEPQDKYLKRMSGIMRLYASIIVTQPPRGSNCQHPHGLEFAWIWLSRVLNTEPQPDITATMIYDMLSVTGHALYEQYRSQFLKLLSFLIKHYIPKIRSVAVGGGPVSRLQTFVETVIKNSGRIAKPEGILPPNFI